MAGDIVRRNRTLAGGPPALPVPQERALAALLTGATVTATARAAGVTRQTVHRWLSDDPAFIAAYNLSRRETGDAVQQNLRLLSAQAVKALRRALTSRRTPDAVKVRAAVEVLKLTAAAPDGPTDFQDARALVARRKGARRRAALVARQ
jgi:hypothetical protein